MPETKEYEQLSPTAGQIILQQLPERIKNAIVARAAEIDYPVEAVIEMARCLRHATRTQAISILMPLFLSIANPIAKLEIVCLSLKNLNPINPARGLRSILSIANLA